MVCKMTTQIIENHFKKWELKQMHWGRVMDIKVSKKTKCQHCWLASEDIQASGMNVLAITVTFILACSLKIAAGKNECHCNCKDIHARCLNVLANARTFASRHMTNVPVITRISTCLQGCPRICEQPYRLNLFLQIYVKWTKL